MEIEDVEYVSGQENIEVESVVGEEDKALVAGVDTQEYFEDSLAEDGLGKIGPLEDNMELVVLEGKMGDMGCLGQGSEESCSCPGQ